MGHQGDVIIIGYGGAGAAAALAAVAAGAKVTILEKNPEGGGNTRYSGGSMRTYLDINKAVDHIEALCEGTTERSVVEAFVSESSKNGEWVTSIGGQVIPTPSRGTPRAYPHSYPLTPFPSVRGADGIGPRISIKGGAQSLGIDLWAVLERRMASTNVKVLYSCPARKLSILDKNQGVTGVIAANGGKDITVKARRGVILTCGGFEYDQSMHRTYLGQNYFGLCNPGNTGDGIRMAAEIGADLWHMNGVASTFGYKFEEFPCAIKQGVSSAGYIYVDQMGRRFMDEPNTDAHMMWAPSSYVDPKTLQRSRIPAYLIFDEDTRMRGSVAETGRGKISDSYHWSQDNTAEIRKGWIKAADNIADLAYQIKIRPDQLQTTLAQYNLQCVSGYDSEYGRAADTLIPLGRSPYYAMEIWPCLFNTQGGPKRNAKGQVLDVWGTPIKRLYSAGELGSLWNRNYPGAGNVSEALAFGRIAGKNAASEPAVTA